MSWQDTTLGALCDAGIARLQTGPFGSQLHSYDYTASGTPVIATEGIGRRRIIDSGLPRVPSDVVARLSRHVLREGDILFARRGAQATGLSALVTERHAGAVCGTGAILLRLSGEGVDPRFLSFHLTLPSTIEWMKTHAVGAVMPNLNEGVLRALPLRLPPIREQRSIASALSALDDKIELNLRMNETLEAMANALFKSWFIDFDPVRAKMAGRAPAYMDAETAALFPIGFEPSGIPSGWKREPALDLFDLLSGGTPRTSESDYWGGSIPWASAKDVSQCGTFFLLNTERRITEAGLEGSSTQIIPKNSVVVVARGATCGRFTVLAEPMAMNQTCYALCAKPGVGPWLLRFSAEQMINELVRQAHGSVFDTITTATFQRATLLSPGRGIADKFESFARPLIEKIRCSQRESEILAQLRNLLLPKLFSGELRVPDTARSIEQIA